MRNVTLTEHEMMHIRLGLQDRLKQLRDSVAYWKSVQPTYSGLKQLETDVDIIECMIQMFLECHDVVVRDVVRRNEDGSIRVGVTV